MKNIWAYAAIGYACFVIGFGFACIGQLIEQPKDGERYGWEMPASAASLVLPVLLFAYKWGKDEK